MFACSSVCVYVCYVFMWRRVRVVLVFVGLCARAFVDVMSERGNVRLRGIRRGRLGFYTTINGRIKCMSCAKVSRPRTD